MPQANPTTRVLLGYTLDGRETWRMGKARRCDWPTTPGRRALNDAITTVLDVLEDAHGFTFVDRDLVGKMASRDILAHAGFPEVECGEVWGHKGEKVDQGIAHLTPTDLVQITWKVAGWLELCSEKVKCYA